MHAVIRSGALALAVSAIAIGTAHAASGEAAKPASGATIAAQRRAAATLPAEDGRDQDFAARGFVTTRTDPLIRAADGHVVWNLDAYGFVTGKAPDTVNPSLWRHMTLLGRHGLFKVADGVWQVRGFDVSNMTVIQGKIGWVLIDPLTSRETARAALDLVNSALGQRPVTAVIYSHSHADHFGGVGGVVLRGDVTSGKVPVIAPEHFLAEAVSENVLAGPAMGRRANFQFGVPLSPGPTGQMGSGIGPAVANGTTTLIAPTDTIRNTGETRLVDGVALEFQIVSGSEAPSELNIYIAPTRTFLSAEMSTCSMHNILTPRGAKVRDALRWSEYLDEALRSYAPRSDLLISSHCWPRFGQGEVAGFLASQRDNYRYLHDQTVRLMNRGETPVEIAEALVQPPALGGQWFDHGYYGTYNHNAKAVYQYYLGWYDAVPANLNPLPPVERAKRMVAAMGGAGKVLTQARRAMASGDYRWSSDLLNQLVFADPANAAARHLLADSYEQQGYQAESAIWRNQFLSAAAELRTGPKRTIVTQNSEVVQAVPTRLLLDMIATRFDPSRLGGQRLGVGLVLTDRSENALLETDGTTLIGHMDAPAADAAVTLTGPRALILGLLVAKMPLAQMQAAGLKVDGDTAALQALLDAIDPAPEPFPIAEP